MASRVVEPITTGDSGTTADRLPATSQGAAYAAAFLHSVGENVTRIETKITP
jgi:hypothetical protein